MDICAPAMREMAKSDTREEIGQREKRKNTKEGKANNLGSEMITLG
jgi:hypothetical protein